MGKTTEDLEMRLKAHNKRECVETSYRKFCRIRGNIEESEI